MPAASDIRTLLLKRLNSVAQKLPNGLLHRLVDDAVFFNEVNMGKARARNSARASQFTNWKQKADDKYFKSLGL